MKAIDIFRAAMLIFSDVPQAIETVCQRLGMEESDVLVELSQHSDAAAQIAPMLKARLVGNGNRAKSVKKIQRLQTELRDAIDALRTSDAAAVAPFNLSDLFDVWTVDASQLEPRKFDAEATYGKRQASGGNVQGKSISRGRGHRVRVWQRGDFILDRGKFAGYGLTITDDRMTAVNPDGDIIFDTKIDWSLSGNNVPGSVATEGNNACRAVYEDLGIGFGNPGAPKFWGMPWADAENNEALEEEESE